MADDAGKKQPGRGPGQPFRPGRSGNPSGRRPGTHNRVSVLAQRLMDRDAEGVILAVIAAATAGDMTAARLVLERVAPLPRNRPVHFVVGAIHTAADIGAAMTAVLQAAAAGELSPDEAASVAGLIEVRRKTVEMLELDQRIAALERTKGVSG